ncbi:zinc finger protein 469 [Spea bombifrons]|uniref:zinc finger protein 469 n=1 Tax=Spea bombifrons TaxID=233779 RepID=UPI00234A8543|nr:zinc finger protein 469 [Spea bombifrons]
MTGETKHVYVINSKEPSPKDSDRVTTYEQFPKNDAVDSSAGGVSDSSESVVSGGTDKAPQLNGSREKETHSQREAVIRPQQAGKIDFKSLHNRSKFSNDAVWTNSKGSPLSPTGKSRGKDKSKRSGKGDRTQHQLYRLSITNSRSNPTIGIAYPQQKVTPPKKLEVSRGPISGSYRFHVPSLPEREAELQQEDLNFNRCFQESSPSLTSTNYTSQKAPASRTHHGINLQSQIGNTHETASSNGQLHFLEFQPNGNSWGSSEKNFSGATNYGQKLCPFPEGNKPDSHCFGTMPLQYPFQSLQEPSGNSFCNNSSSQDFLDVSLPASQVAHGTFSFQSSSREGPDDPQSNGSYSNALPDSRAYGIASQQSPFLHAPQGAQHPPTPPCYTGRNDPSADHNGAISSSTAVTSSGAIDQTQSTFHESQTHFIHGELSLHGNNVPSLLKKRQLPAKDFAPSQRLLTPGNTLRRNIPQTSLNQVHFPVKVYNSVNQGSVPFDKNISRIPQTWDAGSKTFPPLDQSSVSYASPSGNTLPYQCQANLDQRQALKNPKMPWHQIHLTSAMPSQNRIEVSRQIGSQKLPYPLGNSEWPNTNLSQKIPPSYPTKNHTTVDGLASQRSEAGSGSYSSTNGILYDGVKEASLKICDSRNKGILFGLSQPIQQTSSLRNNSSQAASDSPCESPLPSPATNPISGSTCSSLSPMSSSPVNPSSDDNQILPTLTSSPYFHQPCHPVESKTFHVVDPLSSGSLIYPNPGSLKNCNYLSDASKEEPFLKNIQENQYPKQSTETERGCLDGFENEPPPPPPYSSHHLLASSLSSTNLDQLDVILTCKQCDQNYNNLSSFLEHRQYCSLNSTLQDSTQGAEVKKQTIDAIKSSHLISGLPLAKGQAEVHPHLVGFNKVIDYLLDSEVKGDPKDDPAKANIFHSLISNSLPLTACDTLEMDDAKLDSLITEALNGLEFQVDNPEIDSSFIDVFVDDELSASKGIATGQPYKVKDSAETKKGPSIVEEKQTCHNLFSHIYEENNKPEPPLSNRYTTKQNEHKNAEIGTVCPYTLETEKNNTKDVPPQMISDNCDLLKNVDNENCTKLDEKRNIDKSLSNAEFYEEKDTKVSLEGRRAKADPIESLATLNQKPRRPGMKDAKRKKSHNGTWSKELIHKIVQQKNKLHKLHVKSNKNVQFSLVTERLFPPAKGHTFGEYDYISDSGDEADIHGKNQLNGRLKYSFNRDHPTRGGRTREKEWRMGEATRFQLQSKDLRTTKKETSGRIRRRSSQSSTSSDQSTSISSETWSSPKSIERTDSENEPETVVRHKSLTSSNQNVTVERNLVRPLYKENVSEAFFHQAELSKTTKRFGSARFLLASSKVYPSKLNNSTHFMDSEKLQQQNEKAYLQEENCIKSADGQFFDGAHDEHQTINMHHKEILASNLSHDNYPPDLLHGVDNVAQPFSSFRADTIDFQTKQVDVSPSVPPELNSEVSGSYSDSNGLKEGICKDPKEFPMPVSCYSGKSADAIFPVKSHEAYTSENHSFPETKNLPDLYSNSPFLKNRTMDSSEIGQLYLSETNPSNSSNSFEGKCSELPTYHINDDDNKVSSPLSFDSSSIFTELPISDFEAPLFSNIPAPKDNYMPYTCSSDPATESPHFEQQYPQFLRGKSWGIIEDGQPMSSNNITPFQVMENQASGKYGEQMSASSGQMPMTLSESVSDYNAQYINNISEDELEIKRLVTELENQLQTNKMQNNVSSPECSKTHVNSELADAAVHFSHSAVNALESNTKNVYYKENLDHLSGLNHTVNIDTTIEECHAVGKVDSNCGSLKRNWTCPVQFDTFSSSIQCHKPQTSPQSAFSPTEPSDQHQEGVKDLQSLQEINPIHSGHQSPTDACLHDVGNQPECQTFSGDDPVTEALTAGTLLSNSEKNIEFGENTSEPKDPKHLFLKKEQLEERFDEPPELEPFQSVPEINSQLDLQDGGVSVLNMSTPSVKNENSHERELCEPGLHAEMASCLPAVEYIENSSTTDGKEVPTDSLGLQKNLDMPVLEKEEGTVAEKSPVAQESSDNPLQQLQLFVARTAKNNEEEMLMPCFPMSLAGSSHLELESDSSKETLDKSIGLIEFERTTNLPETNMNSANIKQLDAEGNNEFSSTVIFESFTNGTENNIALDTENECMGTAVKNIDTSRQAQDGQLLHNKDTETPFQQRVKLDDLVKDLDEKEENKAAKHKISQTFEAFSIISKNNLTVPDAMEINSTDMSNGYQLQGALTLQVSQVQDDDASGFRRSENQKEGINVFQEKDHLCTEVVPLSKENSDASAYSKESSTHFSMHFSHQKALAETNINYETQFQDVISPTNHSPLDFDLLAHLPLKQSIPKQNILCPGEEVTDGQQSQEKMNDTKDQSEKHSMDRAEMLLYLGKDRCMTSFEVCPKPSTKIDGLKLPKADGTLSPCVCSELECPHYKQQTGSVADILLQGQPMPSGDDYLVYTTSQSQNYSTLNTELFTEAMQNITEQPLCCEKDESLWVNQDKCVHANHPFPSEDRSNAALVCDLMDITEGGLAELNSHQTLAATEEGTAQVSKNSLIDEKRNGLSDPERKCTNDMDSVIDGVLRILDGDKSKEILERIGIPARNSPVKEKKAIESLTCDICLVSFRSKPGLTRHKAAKHSLRNDGNAISHKAGALNENVKIPERSDSNSQNATTGHLTQGSKILPPYFMSDEEQRSQSTKSKGEKKSKGQVDDTSGMEVTCEKKPSGNGKKRKSKAVPNKNTDSQVPSDDILNILKTNILKAIGQSNTFPASEEKVTWTQATDNDKMLAEANRKDVSPQKYLAEDESVVNSILDMEINREPTWVKGFKSQAEHKVNNVCEIESALPSKEETPMNEEASKNIVGGRVPVTESAYGQEDLPVSNVQKDVVPDLHSLFDDDNTFSQLFPRDDSFIRRKCTRVYGKRAKRQTPPFETDFKNIDLIEPERSSQIKDFPPGFGNLSVDSALMGCGLSLIEPDSQYGQISAGKEMIAVDNKIIPFVQQNQGLENVSAPMLMGEHQGQKDLDVSFEDVLFKSPEESQDSIVDLNSTIPDSELDEVYDCKISEGASLPEFPTIDMKMLSAKFDMRELSFFSACGDDSDQSDVDGTDIPHKPDHHKGQSKNKPDGKRQVRNRSNVNIKTKEKQYKCKVCFQWFLTLGELDFHKLTHNPSPPPTCYMCVQRKFSSREQLRDHLKDKHAKNKAGLWICGMCLKEISDVWMYNEHLREHATQFARKGQAQKTVMGIPGCFAEDTMVRTFLSTFIYRTPGRSSKTSESEDKSPAAIKQAQKDHKDDVSEKEAEHSTLCTPKSSVHAKLSVGPSLENTQKNDLVHKNPAIHPHCKDPSRDCHHCGKQFPKPFKLQRHLVVHSLQKIFLCHKCPKSYQEVHELRSHLNNDHQLSEDTEIKHTTLYACELCADVMHVIKKSFICSTCNYTFSKKEQYDRHMEKHLIGGSMTFKFRGVMRPGVGKEAKDKAKGSSPNESMPPCKKQKRFHYSEPDIADTDLKDSSEQSRCVTPVLLHAIALDKELKDNAENAHEITVKTEYMATDNADLQDSNENSLEMPTDSCPASPLLNEMPEEDEDGEKLSAREKMNVSDVEASSAQTEKETTFIIEDSEVSKETEPPVLYPTYQDSIEATHKTSPQEAEISEIGISSPLVGSDDVLCHLLSHEQEEVFASNKDVSSTEDSLTDSCCSRNETVGPEKEDALKSLPLDGSDIHLALCKAKPDSPDVSVSLRDSRGQRKNKLANQVNSRTTTGGEDGVKSYTPKPKVVSETCSVTKDSGSCTLKETVESHHKLSKKEPIVCLSKQNDVESIKSADRASATLPSKLHPKKRKEHKASAHKGCSASRENMAGEVKKKKINLVGSGKNEASGSVKKTEWMSPQSESKEEAPCGRLSHKPHTGGISGQMKKNLFDSHNQKKVSARPSNGEYKCKKVFQTKTLQPFTPKSSALSLNSSSQKRKLGQSTRVTEPSSYRTAESQNNLLSQLFGQRLTSFKIPLRRDVTE